MGLGGGRREVQKAGDMAGGGGRSANGEGPDVFNPRLAFGSASDADHLYNTPRAWEMQRHLNPRTCVWDGPNADFGPESNDIPWCRIPEHKISVEEVKRVLSLHYQGTPYDPYASPKAPDERGKYRCIGINRTSQLSATQLRNTPGKTAYAIQWIAFGSNPFNAFVPLFADVDSAPTYFATTTENVSTDSFYWANRLIGALSDARYASCLPHVERYQSDLVSQARHVIACALRDESSHEVSNEKIARIALRLTD